MVGHDEQAGRRRQPLAHATESRVEAPAYSTDFEVHRVRGPDEIKWPSELKFLSRPLIGRVIDLCENDNDDAEALFRGQIHIGTVDGVTWCCNAPHEHTCRAAQH
jgi:hypothetical protein